MRHNLLSLFIIALIPTCCFALDCDKVTVETPLQKVSATASSWDNFRGNPGSIAYESKQLLNNGTAKIKSSTPPPSLNCPAPCAAPRTAKLKFTSTPEKYLSDYSDKSKCEKLYSETKGAPFSYPGLSFASVDLFSKWYSDFSQGSGKEGKDLYRRCDGSCSPQYITLLTPAAAGYAVNAAAVCGPARDKDQNMYTLATAAVWQCEKAAV